MVLPSVYCEAHDLIKLPSLVLDPVSKKLEANANILESLNSKVQDLSSSPFSRQETARMLCQRAHSECKWINQWINLATVSKGEICWSRDYWNSSGSCSMQVQRWCLLTQEEAIRSYETKGRSLHKPFTMVRPRIKLVFGSLTITALRLSNWGKEEKTREERIWSHAERDWRRNILRGRFLSLYVQCDIILCTVTYWYCFVAFGVCGRVFSSFSQHKNLIVYAITMLCSCKPVLCLFFLKLLSLHTLHIITNRCFYSGLLQQWDY